MMKGIQQSRWHPFIFSMLLFAMAFTIRTLFHWGTANAAGEWMIFVKFGSVFGLVGAIYGAIYALDIRFNSVDIDRPVVRTLVCAGLGGLLVFSLQTPSPTRSFEPIALGAAFSGFLGWMGWRWAKHIEF